MQTKKLHYQALKIIAAIVFVSLSVIAHGDVVTNWNLIAIKTAKKAGQNSNYATRTLAIEAIAVYDAINSIKQFGTPYHYYSVPKSPASEQAAAAQAAHDVLVSLFPAQKASLDSFLDVSLKAATDGPVAAGQQVGSAAAADILVLRANDGAYPDVSYSDPTNARPGDYRLTPPAFKPGIDEQWGNVKPFLLKSNNQFLPPPPPALGTDEYKKALAEVESLGSEKSTTRTDEQTHIAQFYKQDAELGVNEAARVLAQLHKTSIEDNALIFVLVDIAEADARIEVWVAKYKYLFWRPVTALNANDDGTITNNYSKWTPLISTPTHPDYPSGHSGAVTAGFDVLKSFFGDKDKIELHTTTQGEPARTVSSLSTGESEMVLAAYMVEFIIHLIIPMGRR